MAKEKGHGKLTVFFLDRPFPVGDIGEMEQAIGNRLDALAIVPLDGKPPRIGKRLLAGGNGMIVSAFGSVTHRATAREVERLVAAIEMVKQGQDAAAYFGPTFVDISLDHVQQEA